MSEPISVEEITARLTHQIDVVESGINDGYVALELLRELCRTLIAKDAGHG